MPCTSLKEASWLRNSLLSTGLVGSWFCSCASSSVRKSVPPSVTPLADPPFAVLEPLVVEPLAAVVPVPVVPVPVPVALVPRPVDACVVIITLMSLRALMAHRNDFEEQIAHGVDGLDVGREGSVRRDHVGHLFDRIDVRGVDVAVFVGERTVGLISLQGRRVA